MSKEEEAIVELLEEIITASGKRPMDIFYYLKAEKALALLQAKPEKEYGWCCKCGGLVVGSREHPCDKCGSKAKDIIVVEIELLKLQAKPCETCGGSKEVFSHDGKSCSKGCQGHVTHACEKCGRQWPVKKVPCPACVKGE